MAGCRHNKLSFFKNIRVSDQNPKNLQKTAEFRQLLVAIKTSQNELQKNNLRLLHLTVSYNRQLRVNMREFSVWHRL